MEDAEFFSVSLGFFVPRGVYHGAGMASRKADHVQVAPDRPHIRQAFGGWMAAGGWVRINPSPEYVAELLPPGREIP